MPKKIRTVRANPRDYIPYGKPEEVDDSRVTAELIGGEWVLVRRQTKRPGVSSTTPPAQKRRTVQTQGLHPNCSTARGVSMLFTRDGRSLCRNCYILTFDIEPLLDDLCE